MRGREISVQHQRRASRRQRAQRRQVPRLPGAQEEISDHSHNHDSKQLIYDRNFRFLVGEGLREEHCHDRGEQRDASNPPVPKLRPDALSREVICKGAADSDCGDEDFDNAVENWAVFPRLILWDGVFEHKIARNSGFGGDSD